MRLALSNALTQPLSRLGGGGGETPLQQAVIGAWDMQEATGAALPSKGSALLDESNAAIGTGAGPSGLNARVFTDAIGNNYLVSDDESIFRAPLAGVKTIRWWGLDTSTATAFYLKKSFTTVVTASGDEYTVNIVAPGTSSIARLGDDSNRAGPATRLFGGNEDKWRRFELVLDRDSEEVRMHAYDLDSDTEETNTLSVTGGVFVGSNAAQIGIQLVGKMCLLAIFNRALTPAERTADETPTRYADLGK